MSKTSEKMIEDGIRIADCMMYRQDKIWSRYSNDKVDIGETLARVIRSLSRYLPIHLDMNALSIGSSNEPQFRILQSAFSGNLFLLDIEKQALETIRERITRQHTSNVVTLGGDFNRTFSGEKSIEQFREKRLSGKRMELVTLQHSLYYRKFSRWQDLVEKLYRMILAPQGALYMVLMSSKSEDPDTTTWLYNHFAGRFAGHRNDQCLRAFRDQLVQSQTFRDAEILMKTSYVKFFVEDFKKLMAVVWMILLHPHVHVYTPEQCHEITEYIYEYFYKKRKPLIQSQEHLVIYRDLKGPGRV
jgi:hypothetical protein